MVHHRGSPSVTAPRRPLAIVGIPANNEEERIGACLAALATQRDDRGAPLPAGSFEIIVFANNCTDATVATARSSADAGPHPVDVVAERLPAERSNAGWARKCAMDLAADRLAERRRPDGVILTTDADSRVAPTWIDATWRALAMGADAVAGYIDADPLEMTELGSAFVERGRLEDRYSALVAELYGLCDPRPHDPWPNHRVASGASLAVTLAAYRAIGGLPPKPLGEDVALAQALDDAGFKLRHAMDVSVVTSCRLAGRVPRGAADTMRHRHQNLDAPCDDDFEPVFHTLRRAIHKGRLRRCDAHMLDTGAWTSPLGLGEAEASSLLAVRAKSGFESFWLALRAASPVLRQRVGLRPSDLPREIRRAELCLGALAQARMRRSSR